MIGTIFQRTTSETPYLWDIETDACISPQWEIHDSVNHYIRPSKK